MAIRGLVDRRNAVADVNVMEENGMVTITVRAMMYEGGLF